MTMASAGERYARGHWRPADGYIRIVDWASHRVERLMIGPRLGVDSGKCFH